MKKNPIFRFLSSLKLAVLVILMLAAILAYGTIAESDFGGRGAHVLVYGTPWFGFVLLLLGVNVLCAALSRYPWKSTQTGFVITHTGILMMLFGSVLTQRLGVDGSLPVVEGQQDNEVILSDLELSVADEDSSQQTNYPMPETAKETRGKVMEIAFPDGKKLVVDRFIPRAAQQTQIVKSPVAGVGSPAVHVELSNSRFRVDEWLLVNHPGKATEVNLGPAILSFKQLWSAQDEKNFEKNEKPPAPAKPTRGYVVMDLGGKQFRLDIDSKEAAKYHKIEGTQFEYRLDRYLPYAIVQNNELVNKSDEPANPAAQIVLRGPGGTEEKHTVFANFPEFNTLHRAGMKKGQQTFEVKLRMVAGAQARQQQQMSGTRGQLHFAQSADHKTLFYKVLGQDGKVAKHGTVNVGKDEPTGWMDLQFKVTEWHDSAIEDTSPRSIEYISGGGEANFASAVHVVVDDGTRAVASEQGTWLPEGASRTIPLGDRNVEVRYGKKRMALPFALFLEKFTMGTDPGTTKAASYASRVRVRDAAKPAAGDKSSEISMNEPLDHGGYSFYQASYIMEEGRPPVSVFSVNYDPGRWVKYSGAIVMVLGSMIMFYMNPHYWAKVFGSPARRKEDEEIV